MQIRSQTRNLLRAVTARFSLPGSAGDPALLTSLETAYQDNATAPAGSTGLEIESTRMSRGKPGIQRAELKGAAWSGTLANYAGQAENAE